jgi:type IV pilus assembly protein PilY1
MNNHKQRKAALAAAKRWITYVVAGTMIWQPVLAGPTDISSIPLASSQAATVLPNLLFTLDNSGSMAWDFLPDYVDPNTSGLTSTPCMKDSAGSTRCTPGEPPYAAGGELGFNGVGYDPTLNYAPAINSSGATLLSSPLSTTALQTDAFNSLSGTTNLTTGSPDQKYCNAGSPAICKRNGADVNGIVTPLNSKDDRGNNLAAGQFPYRTNRSNSSSVVFGMPEMLPIGTFTRSVSTVTVTTIAPHGLTTSDTVYVTGTASVNVTCAAVSSATANTFTYTTSGSGTVAATTGSYRRCESSSFTRAGTTVTVTSTSHGLVTGDLITVNSNASSTLNASNVAVTVTSSSTFTYTSGTSGTVTPIAGTWVRTGLYNVTTAVTGNPVAYRITPVEYCADVNLTNCVEVIPGNAVPVGFPNPAYVRFCQNQDQATTPGAVADTTGTPRCRSKYVNSTGLPQYIFPRYGWFVRDTIQATVATYTGRTNRDDCAAKPTCTYTEEMQNYARWYTYYRTRIQMMKTALGRAVLNFVSNPPTRPASLRVGFITIHAEDSGTIDNNQYLKINDFTPTQASSFYTTLYKQTPGNATPLQEALARAGWIFAGKMNTGLTAGIPAADDPVQASCQRNFTIMTTDGYWNGNLGKTIAGKSIGNLDAVDPTVIAPYTQVMVDRATTGIFDGGGASTSVVSPQNTLEQIVCTGSGNTAFGSGTQTPCGCTGSQKRVMQRTTTTSTITTSVEGQNPTTTTSTSVTFQPITSCNALVTTTTKTPVTYTEQQVCSRNNTITFSVDGSQKACNCPSGARSQIIQETITGATQTVVTTDGVQTSSSFNLTGATKTYQAASSSGGPFTSFTGGTAPTASCTSSTITAAAPAVNAAGATTTSSSTGASITNADITISPNPQTSAGTQTTTTTPGGVANTLADTALYFYENDLRGGRDGNGDATGPSMNLGGTGTVDVSTNNLPVKSGAQDFVTHQHMNTFTVGMADGLMRYQSDYATASTGDFANIKSKTFAGCFWTGGFCDWPLAAANSPSALDDLWHAAVNGRGQFYQALNANQLAAGLNGALAALQTQVAAAAAAATSSQNVTRTDNQAFSTTYETTTWSGKIVMQLLDPVSAIPGPVQWQADQLLLNRLGPAGCLNNTPNNCDTDTRNILTRDTSSPSGVKPLQWLNLTATEQGWFSNKCTPTSTMTQCGPLSTSSPASLAVANDGQQMLNYLRGHTINEGAIFRDRITIDPITNATQQTILGDTVDAKPVFVRNPILSYTDLVTPSYANYASAQTNRPGRVFVGGNDGYLHAFDANTGVEAWAYAPRFLLPEVYILADTNYANFHRYFVDGTAVTADVYDASSTAWKTILVGGTGAGGRGFYALDITDADNPKSLWEFCSNSTLCTPSDTDLGLSYANPIVGKRASDGRWVVVLTSGLNNGSSNLVNPGSGGGFFYVLDAFTGSVLNKIPTNVGTAATPSGLMKMAGFFDSPQTDATFRYVYAGDQLGNVWRLDMGTTAGATPIVTHMATLTDNRTGSTPAPRGQPITTQPVPTFISAQRVLYIGTGRYLGTTDLSDQGPTSGIAYQQSLYAIKDKDADYGNVRDDPNMQVQLETQLSPTQFGVTGSVVNWLSQDGWLIDFIGTGERVNINMLLILGTLSVVTTVPNLVGAAACTTGGVSNLLNIDFRSGLPLPGSGGVAGVSVGQQLVGITGVETSDGTVHGIGTPGGGGPPIILPIPITSSGAGMKRFSYRER